MIKNLYQKVNFQLLFLCIAFLMFTFKARAQTIQVSGRVTNTEDNTPISSVTVKQKGASVAVKTDANGGYKITVPSNAILIFSSVGFKSIEQGVNGRTKIDTQLVFSDEAFDEIVVVGYGTMKKSQITGSVSTLNKKVLETGVRANPASALAGTIPGLRVQQTSGRPGAIPNIVLRGGTNFGGSGSPLVIVDGLLRSGFSDISQDDIESIEVLKDASATAIYGARASNGVVLITTKKGKSGAAQIEFKSNIGFGTINNPYQFLNAADYIGWSRRSIQVSGVYEPNRLSQLNAAGPFGTGNIYKDASGNYIDGNKNASAVWSTMFLNDENREKLAQGWKTMIDPVTGKDIIYNEFNYRDYALRSSALTQDYATSISGGNDQGKYYAGLGFYNEQGLPINTFYKRITFVLNAEYKIRPWLKSISALNFATANWRDAQTNNEGNYFTRSLGAPPTMRGRNENGELLVGRDVGDGNPLVNDAKFIRRNNSEKITMSQAFQVDILKDLYFKASGNWFYNQGFNEGFDKDYLNSPGNINISRNSYASYSKALSQTYNGVFNYSKTFFNHHNVDAMIGGEFYDIYSQGLSASGSGAPTDDFMDLALTNNEANRRSIDTYHVRERILSGFSRLNYDYQKKYLMTLTYRTDGYSRLLNNRWGGFPGVSLGWNLHNESFFSKYKTIVNTLKLRGSYGVNGNVNPDFISPYGLQGAYGTSRYDGVVGFSLSSLPNPNLRWERSTTYEFGLDATILDKIDFSAAYYNRKTSDKITQLVLPVVQGFNTIFTNNGTFGNQGVELSVNYRVLQSKDWDINFQANTAYNANKVIKLPENGLENNRQGGMQVYDAKSGRVIWVGGLQEGQDPNMAYSYVADGLYRTQSDLDQHANRVDLNGYRRLLGPGLYNTLTSAEQAKFFPIALGDVKWKDLDNNDTIDFRDRQYVGRTVPRWTGGFSTSIRWKQLTLSARFDYALGFVQYDGPRSWFLGNMQGTFNSIAEVKDTWTPENPNAKYPTYYWADQLYKNNYNRTSNMFYKRGDYLAVRELVLSYSLPKNIANKLKTQAITFNVTGQNLGYLSQSTLFSPEADSQGLGGGGFPLPRTVIFGARITF